MNGFICLFACLFSPESSSTKGITETNPYIDIHNFFTTQVIPELLASDKETHAILQADCLKFVAIFRQQLPKEYYVQLMPILTRFLTHENVVVHSYASYAIERMLSVKEANGSLRFDKAALQPFLQKCLESLFTTLQTHDESKENEYLMRAVMRICSVGQDTMVPFASVIIGKVTQILSYVSQNPKNPKFNHCLFETIAALIK